MNKRALLLTANLAITAVGGGIIGYSAYMNHQGGAAREARVRALVERFHGCPERFQADRECFTPDERVQMLQSAERAEREGRFEEAGRTYVSLIRSLENDQMEAKAREMAGRCSEEARREINTEILARQEAIRRGLQSVPQGSASAQPVQAPPVQAPQPDAGVQQQPDAAQAPDAGAPDAAPEVRRVTITFNTRPTGVEIFSGDQRECTTNPGCQLTVEAGNWGLEYRLVLPGYRAETRSVTPDRDQTVDVTMQRQQAGGTSRPPRTERREPRQPVQPQVEPRPPGTTVITSPD